MQGSLSDLIAALAAATGPSRELDERMATEVFGFVHAGHGYLRAPSGMFHRYRDIPQLSASLDAITGAVEQRWMGCDWHATSNGPTAAIAYPPVTGELEVEATAATPALALCLAAARLALAEGGR